MAKVILNVGHGGRTKDPGACANGHKENQWNEDFVTKYLIPTLDKNNIEYKVVRQDTFPTLARQINSVSKRGDFTISFHLNASSSAQSNGCEVLYYITSRKSKKLAEIFQSKILSTLNNKDRGILPRVKADRGGSLLYNTKEPCVILEPCFITNPNEIETITAKRQELAEAYTAGIKEYFAYLKDALA